jgi:hypothetical protein
MGKSDRQRGDGDETHHRRVLTQDMTEKEKTRGVDIAYRTMAGKTSSSS